MRFLYRAFDLGESEEGVRSGSRGQADTEEEVVHCEEEQPLQIALVSTGHFVGVVYLC